MNRRTMGKAVLGLAGAAIALSVGMGSALAQDKLKVGFVYVGPISDHGYSYQHDQGRLAVEKELGDKVTTTFVENVPEGADAERHAEREGELHGGHPDRLRRDEQDDRQHETDRPAGKRPHDPAAPRDCGMAGVHHASGWRTRGGRR